MVLWCLMPMAQLSFETKLVSDLCTPNDDVLCGWIDQGLVVTTNDARDYVNDLTWNEHRVFAMHYFEKKDSYTSFEKRESFFPVELGVDIGTTCYDALNGMLYFSTSHNFGGATGGRLKLYSMKREGNGWNDPKVMSFCNPLYDYTHPWYDPELKLLTFSSNTIGTRGEMDIWIAYATEEGFTDPVNLGVMINSPGNELFPVFFDNDIYYCSNGLVRGVGYDLFRAVGDERFENSVQLPPPFNGPHDDLRICWMDQDNGFLTSNRTGGKGGDDIYKFTRLFPPQPQGECYTAQLTINDVPANQGKIAITNSLGDVLIAGALNEKGEISLEKIPFYQRVRLTVSGIDPALFPQCKVLIRDINGNVIRELRLNAMGWVELELLPFDYSDLRLVENVDRSVLRIDLDGQIVTKESSPLKGVPVTIVDEKGNVVAVATAGEKGNFTFTGLNPELNYTFRLSGKSEVDQIVLTDQGKEIILPVLKQEAMYRRVDAKEAIELVNENNQRVFLSPKDIFVVNRIYYSSNSAVLSDEAQRQLDQLLSILQKNPNLKLELIAHTDARGAAEKNMLLSQSRAESIKSYLVKKGVAPERLLCLGKGESQLINNCKDGVQCSDAQHAVNRRTEIRLLN